MKQNCAGRPDHELLALIRTRNVDEEAAADAWLELYSRHVRFIYSQVQSAGTLVGRGVNVEDVVERVFQRVWLGAADQFHPGRYADPDDSRRHVLAWLGQIATHEFMQVIASRGHEYLSARDPVTLQKSQFPERGAELTDKAVHVRRIAESVLSSDELEIVWLKMQHYDPSTGESRIPPEDLNTLCLRQSITKEVFRKRYERALSKIKGAHSCTAAASYNE